MAKIQKQHWISIFLFVVAISLMAVNIFRTARGTKDTTIEILAWAMLIIANLYMLWINYRKSKSNSLKE